MADLHFVFIHGTFGSPTDWDIIQQKIAIGTNYSTSTVTLPGHAARALQGNIPVFTQLTNALEEALTQRCIVVGYSLGGRVALHTLIHSKRPLPVCALVLEGAHPGIEDPRQRKERARLDCVRAQELRQRGVAAFLRDWYRLPLFGLDECSSSDFEALIQERAHAADADQLARVIEEASPGRVPSMWASLAQLSVPLLYLHGEKDAKYQAVGQDIQRYAPRTTVHSIAGAGHNAHRDAPTEYTRRLLHFAEQFDVAGPGAS